MLRGIFTLRRSELLFFYQDGASHLFADAWEGFVAPIPLEVRTADPRSHNLVVFFFFFFFYIAPVARMSLPHHRHVRSS